MEIVQKTGRFYTGIIMRNIGIFIFIGLLSVLFQPDGWIPNETMYAVSQFAYNYALPSMIAFAGGDRIGGHEGGILSVLALCGILLNAPEMGLFGAMITGPVCGFIWKREGKMLENSRFAELQMLLKNLTLGITGGILAAIEYYLVTKSVDLVAAVLEQIVTFLIRKNYIAFLNVLIEPAKIFFLNNIVNHGIFVPLGMRQAGQTGRSILFLLETNPGPGLGVILGLILYYRKDKKRRRELMSVAVTEAVGGVHEVYFPLILENMRLLVPLVLGGMTGTVCFSLFQCGTAGVVSPGSMITILILSDPNLILKTALGILASTAVSGFFTVVCMRGKKKSYENRPNEAVDTTEDPGKEMKTEMTEKEIYYHNLQKVGFVCDGGMGSSAMGAALFRRNLAVHGIQGIEVKAYAVDLIPDDLDLIVCQKDFYQLHGEIQKLNCYVISGFTAKEEYEELVEKMLK